MSNRLEWNDHKQWWEHFLITNHITIKCDEVGRFLRRDVTIQFLHIFSYSGWSSKLTEFLQRNQVSQSTGNADTVCSYSYWWTVLQCKHFLREVQKNYEVDAVVSSRVSSEEHQLHHHPLPPIFYSCFPFTHCEYRIYRITWYLSTDKKWTTEVWSIVNMYSNSWERRNISRLSGLGRTELSWELGRSSHSRELGRSSLLRARSVEPIESSVSRFSWGLG